MVSVRQAPQASGMLHNEGLIAGGRHPFRARRIVLEANGGEPPKAKGGAPRATHTVVEVATLSDRRPAAICPSPSRAVP
jgi:hypothetical protein